jgi:hypothetical protein
MDAPSIETLGNLYQAPIILIPKENKLLFHSLFCLEKYIAKNSCIDLIINDKIIHKPYVCFYGEVEIYKWYYMFTCFSPNECIKNSVLSMSIKNADGLEVGSWKICDNIIDNDGIYLSF